MVGNSLTIQSGQSTQTRLPTFEVSDANADERSDVQEEAMASLPSVSITDGMPIPEAVSDGCSDALECCIDGNLPPSSSYRWGRGHGIRRNVYGRSPDGESQAIGFGEWR